MPEQLQPNGNPVRVGNVTLRTPGLAGAATYHTAVIMPAMRAATMTTDALETAMATEGLRTMQTIELTGTREVPAGATQTRSTTHGDPAIEIQVPDPGAQWGQVVLYTDEAGLTTWNFARDQANQIDVTRGSAMRTYVVGRAVTRPADRPGTRGLVGAIGKKVLQVVVFPLLDPVIGEVGDYFAARWEKAKRPYRLRSFTPDDYAAPDAPTLVDADWTRLAQGPALLMVHGTFSRAHTAFGGLPRETVAALHQRYGGRVIALDHYTLSEDPLQNVEWLVQQLPANLSLDLDIVCHSRGGLVSRVIAEEPDKLSLADRRLNIRRVVFVAAPNAGTVLADPARLGDLIDTYTNILNFFPDNGVTDTLETIITVVKQIAVGAAKGLEGLVSMKRDGPFLAELNRTPKVDSQYFALASNYEPPEAGLKEYAKDLLLDKLFGADNDLIVPTNGVWEKNGAGQFPIETRQVFSGREGVQHGGFFRHAGVNQKLLEWLSP
jgi:hypothetical protein